MYAIHARKVHPEADLKISLFEKASKPQWKVSALACGYMIGFSSLLDW
jgi:hypothetical protein